MRIGTLAEYANCQVETIRYYERVGLLPSPPRSRGNYRLYNEAYQERLRFIRRCRSFDMSLAEVRVLLRWQDAPDRNCATVNKVLDEHIDHVASRIAELRGLEQELRDLRGLCRRTQAARHCRILQSLSAGGIVRTRSRPRQVTVHQHSTH